MKGEFLYCKKNLEIWEGTEKYNKEFQRNGK